jgi:hypothetical protein
MLGLGSRNGSTDRPLVASSALELSSAEMFVFVKAAGILGRLVGRDTKLRVDKFYFDYFRPQASAPPQLLAVRCASNSILALSEVDSNRFDRVPLTFEECVKMDRRTRSFVLDAERYPEIHYAVETETPTSIEGSLSIRGHTAPVKCTKVKNEAELIVECGLKLSELMLPTYGVLGGLMKVSDDVLVQMRVPNAVLEKAGF